MPTNPHVQPMTLQQWSILVSLSIIWGSSFFFVEIIVKEIPPITLVALRVLLAAIILSLLLFIKKTPLTLNKTTIYIFSVMGLLNSVLPYVLIAWGQQYISSGLAATLNASTPIFSVIAAHFFTSDEKITTNKLTGVVIGFLGVVVMLSDSINESENLIIGKIAVILAAICYATGAIFSKKANHNNITPLQTATGQMTASAIFLTPMAFVFESPWTLSPPSLLTWGSMAGLVLFSSVLAYILFFQLLTKTGATNLLLVAFLIPVSSIALGVLFLNEILTTKHLLGMLCIGVGLTILDGRATQALKKRLA
ncbi:DMT family transporter [Sessilibacter sp. MAH2]